MNKCSINTNSCSFIEHLLYAKDSICPEQNSLMLLAAEHWRDEIKRGITIQWFKCYDGEDLGGQDIGGGFYLFLSALRIVNSVK